MKKLTNLIILDASGSMQSKTNDVKGGLKQTLTDIKADAERDLTTVTTATIVTEFASSGTFKVITNSKNSTDLDPESADKYKPGGGTALYDAIDKAFKLVADDQESVFVTIFTDGEENDSKEMTSEGIKALIADRKGKNWVITFMGTTEEDINRAVHLGVSRGNTMSFTNDSVGATAGMSKMKSMRNVFYTSNVNPGVYSRGIDMNNLVAEDDLVNGTGVTNSVTTDAINTILNSTTGTDPKATTDDNKVKDTKGKP